MDEIYEEGVMKMNEQEKGGNIRTGEEKVVLRFLCEKYNLRNPPPPFHLNNLCTNLFWGGGGEGGGFCCV